MNSSDIELEFAVHVFVGFGEVAVEDLYCSLEDWILEFLEAVSMAVLFP